MVIPPAADFELDWEEPLPVLEPEPEPALVGTAVTLPVPAEPAALNTEEQLEAVDAA